MGTAQSVIVYVFGLILVLVLAKLLAKPIKVIFKIMFNTLLGGLVLILLNTVGSIWGFSIGVNPVTALVTGILGVPGILLLVVLKLIFI